MTDSRPECRTSFPAASFDSHRRRLLSIAYRMLGSRAEAEDVVQDAWLKWHAADTGALREPAAWLTTVVTRLSIDRLRALQTERAARQSGWLPEPWLEPAAPSAEDDALDGAQLSYGLMLLLEKLSPDERAAFLLREAFDCDYAEIGAAIGRSGVHCRQLVHRAKARLARAGAPSRPADPARQRHLVDRLRAAIEAQDQAALLDVLAGARVVSDTAAPVVAGLHAETVSLGADAGVALLANGDVVALWVPWTDAHGAVTLYRIGHAAALSGVNRTIGREAIARLLARVARGARSTIACAG